jgi:hypothetical protein
VSAQCFLTPFRGGGKLFLNNLLNSKAFLLKDKEVFDSTNSLPRREYAKKESVRDSTDRIREIKS